MSLDSFKSNALTSVIYGKTGSGKSYLAHWTAKKYYQNNTHDRIVVVSTTDQDYYEYLPNFSLLTIDDRTSKKLDFDKLLFEHPFLYIELIGLDERNAYFLNKLSKSVRGMGNCLVLIDEAHQLFSRYTDAKFVRYLIRQGRKNGIEWILASQQPVDIAKEGATQANIIITFRNDDKAHVERLSKRLQVSGDKIRNLDDYEYVIRNTAEGKTEIESTSDLT